MEAVRQTGDEVRVVLMSRHTLPRLGLVRLLEGMEGTRVVAHTGSPSDGVRLAEEFSPDVVLVDSDLAADDGMAVISALKARAGHTRVLLMADDVAHSQIERALEAGADGYTLKDIGVNELGQAMGRLAAGDTVLHPEAASARAPPV
jgi:DNA-binding NarL/FixJ family response regulator